MYHAACKVEFQLFNRSYSQLTFFEFFKISADVLQFNDFDEKNYTLSVFRA